MLSPAIDNMTESSTHCSSDEDSSNKQDVHQMREPPMDSFVPSVHFLVLEKEPSGEELTEPVPVDVGPMDVESLTVEDQKQDEDSPASSFDTSTRMLTCQMTSDSLDPNNVDSLISSDVELVKNSEHVSVQHTPKVLSRKTSSGSVCSHHVSFLDMSHLFNLQAILRHWFY